jgi:hypothetical protein
MIFLNDGQTIVTTTINGNSLVFLIDQDLFPFNIHLPILS